MRAAIVASSIGIGSGERSSASPEQGAAPPRPASVTITPREAAQTASHHHRPHRTAAAMSSEAETQPPAAPVPAAAPAAAPADSKPNGGSGNGSSGLASAAPPAGGDKKVIGEGGSGPRGGGGPQRAARAPLPPPPHLLTSPPPELRALPHSAARAPFPRGGRWARARSPFPPPPSRPSFLRARAARRRAPRVGGWGRGGAAQDVRHAGPLCAPPRHVPRLTPRPALSSSPSSPSPSNEGFGNSEMVQRTERLRLHQQVSGAAAGMGGGGAFIGAELWGLNPRWRGLR